MMEALVYRLGWALVHFLWQGAAVALVLAVALALLQRRSANVRYLVATAALLVLAIAPVVTFIVIAAPISYPDNPTAVAHVDPPQHAAPVANVVPLPATQHTQNTAPAPTPIVVPGQSPPLPIQPDAAPTAPLSAPAAADPPLAEVAQNETPLEILESLRAEGIEWTFPWLVASWLVGAALLALRLLGGWLWLHRSLTESIAPVQDTRFIAVLADLSERLGLRWPVQLLESALIQTPLVFGWLRPVILLPLSAVSGLTVNQWEAILAHELAHIRRHDYVVNLVQSVIETLLFYHPAVWWVSRCIRQERENCCDDMAVALCGDRLTYARALAQLEHLRQQPISASAAVAVTGGVLMKRIRRLIGLPETPRQRARNWLAGLIVLSALLVGGVAMYVLAQPTLSEASNLSETDTTAQQPELGKKPTPDDDKQEPKDPEEKKLHELIQRSDRIVVAELSDDKSDPPRLLFKQTIKGQHNPLYQWPASDQALEQALRAEPAQAKWILFLKADDGTQNWTALTPAQEKDWFRPFSDELVKKVRAVLPAGFTWSEAAKGLRLGLRVRNKHYQPHKDIVVEVAVQNVSKETLNLRNQRYNIYDYWPNLHFVVTDPKGKQWMIAKPVVAMDEADWPHSRTLAPDEMYIHAIRLEQWPVEDPGKLGGAALERFLFAEPGSYKVRAVYQNDELSKWFQWSGKLTAGPITITVAAPAVGEPPAQVKDLIQKADRIVVAKENKGQLHLERTLQGPHQKIALPFDDALLSAMGKNPNKSWVVFLKANEHMQSWAKLGPLRTPDWYKPYTEELVAQIVKEVSAGFAWGQPTKGLAFGLRLRPIDHATYLPGQPITVDVALGNEGTAALKLLELRYNIYDYWPDLTFEVTDPDGKKWILAKPDGPITEDDSPNPRTLQPGEVYVHSVRLDQWPIQGEPPIEKALSIFTHEGGYQVRAVYQNQLTPKGFHNAGKLMSSTVKFGVKENQTQRALHTIQMAPETFGFQLTWHGEPKKKDQSEFRSLWFFTFPVGDIDYNAQTVEHFPAADLNKVAEFLARDGFFERAQEITFQEKLDQKFEGYSWTITSESANLKPRWYEKLGWSPAVLKKLQGLRQVLKAEAAQKMDSILKEWQSADPGPQPAQTEKTKKAVEHLKNKLDQFMFTLWPKGNHYAEQGFKHLILARVPPNTKPPDVVHYVEIKAEQALKLIDHLAEDGFFERAVDFNQFPKDFEFGPSFKETSYAIIVHTQKGPRYYEKYQLGPALVERFKKLQKQMLRTDLKFPEATQEYAAFGQIVNHLEGFLKTKKSVDAIKKTSKKVSFEMRCTIAKGARDAELKSVWFSHGLPPFITLGARSAGLEDEDFHQLVDFLAADGFFARAQEMTLKEASQVPVQGYSMRLFGLYEEKILHDTLTLDRAGMKRLESFAKAFKGRPSIFDAMIKEWEPLRKTWQEIDAGIEDAKQKPEKFSLLVRFHGDARFPYRSVWLHGGPLPPKADLPFIVQPVKLTPKEVTGLVSYLAQQHFVQYAETDPGVNGFPAGPNYTLHVHGIGSKTLYQRLNWYPEMLSILSDLAARLEGNAQKEFDLLRKELDPIAKKWHVSLGAQAAQKVSPPPAAKPPLVKVEMNFDKKQMALKQPIKLTITYTNVAKVPVYVHHNADPTFRDYDNQGEVLMVKKGKAAASWYQLKTRGSFGPPKKLEPGESWTRNLEDVTAIATPAADGYVPQVFEKKFISAPGTWDIDIRPFKVSQKVDADFGDTECTSAKLVLTSVSP